MNALSALKVAAGVAGAAAVDKAVKAGKVAAAVEVVAAGAVARASCAFSWHSRALARRGAREVVLFYALHSRRSLGA